MTDASEIIDAKIKEFGEKIQNENEELEKTKSFRYQNKCRKIVLVSTVIMLIASTYVLITVNEIKEFLILQIAIYVAYIGVSAIPRYMFTNVLKSKKRVEYMERKIEGFEWLKTRAPDQQENFLNIMKNRGLI
ncbi:MAG: hypothetical protein WC788_09685 [Candidatus Paceibacterota bacterium]|jgi:hypothetical protein